MFPTISLWQIMTSPGVGPVWTQGARFAGFILYIATQNIKALCHVVLKKKIFFMFFPIVSLWELSVAMEKF